MDRKDLEKSWRKTTRHLKAAREQLPKEVAGAEEGWSIQQYEEWLAHNELELAFDELEGLGDEHNCGRGFWLEMHAAAENMGLLDKATRCQERADKASA
jgi:hypothetical protein